LSCTLLCMLRVQRPRSLFLLLRPPPRPPLFPYTTLFRSSDLGGPGDEPQPVAQRLSRVGGAVGRTVDEPQRRGVAADHHLGVRRDRKSTRLNSSHVKISYALFCLKKKKAKQKTIYESLEI